MSDTAGSSYGSDLSLTCRNCFLLLQGWIQLIRKLAKDRNGEDYTAVLISIANELDEHRLRIDIWMLDCNVKSFGLPTHDEEPLLYETISIKLNELLKLMLQIGSLPLECIRKDDVESIRPKFQAQSKEISLKIRELAKLQSLIEMAQAVHRGLGPYSKIQKHVLAISNSMAESGGKTLSEVTHSETGTVNMVYCQRCRESFPSHVLPFHSDFCSGEASRLETPDRPQILVLPQIPNSTSDGTAEFSPRQSAGRAASSTSHSIVESSLRQNFSVERLYYTMAGDNRFIQDATKHKCRSLEARDDLWKRAVRKNGKAKNGEDNNLLFPRALIEAVLTHQNMLRIMECQCIICRSHAPEPIFTRDLPHHIMQNWIKRRAFAVLVYMGATFAATSFFRGGLGTEGFNLQEALHELESSCALPKIIHKINYFKDFAKVFESTRLLFEPPFFQKQNVRIKFTDDQNFPFLFEKPIQKSLPSSFGTLYGFWLHKDFCDGIPSIDIPCQPEDHTLVADEQFPESKLARKQIRGPEDAIMSERRILEFVAKEDHPHLIKLYFWYQQGPYFNLVFPYYPASLQHVLVEGWLPKQQPPIPERFKASLLRHWLWEQILNVIEGLERVHNPKDHQNRFSDIQGHLIGGHFDIKPANILIDYQGQLVLADFGQAQIKSSSSGATAFTGPGGMVAYQPPPPPKRGIRDPQQHWNRSYDVWSMACVMLETIHFIVLGGTGGVKKFVAEREREEPPNTKSSAFWKDTPEGPLLKECVQASLMKLKSKNDRYLTMVAKLLLQMFSIDAKPRGSILDCVEKLSKDNFTDQWPWKDEDEVSIAGDHTNKSLKKLSVSVDFTASDESYKSIKCSVHIFRDISVEYRAKYRAAGRGEAVSYDHMGDNVRVVLDFDQDDRNHMLSERGSRLSEVLKPLTYFPDRKPDVPLEDLGHSSLDTDLRACAFLDMHRKLTLNFRKSHDYHRFQTAMTQQHVYDVSHASISRCWMLSYKKTAIGRHAPKKYSSGRVEIWNELSDREYHNNFVARIDRSYSASPRTGADSRASSITSTPSDYRSVFSNTESAVGSSISSITSTPAAFTSRGRLNNPLPAAEHHPKTAPTPRRLVVYLENEKIILTTILNSIVIVKNRSDHIDPKSSLCLSFLPHPGPPTHKYFELGEFRGSENGRDPAQGNAASLHDTCPGIPLHPRVLSDSERTRVEWLEIEFADPHGKTNFVNLYNQIFKSKPINVKGQDHA